MKYRDYELVEVTRGDAAAEINAFALILVAKAEAEGYCGRAAEVYNNAAKEYNKVGSFRDRSVERAKNYAAFKGIAPDSPAYDALVEGYTEMLLSMPEVLSKPDPHLPKPTPKTPAKRAPRKAAAAGTTQTPTRRRARAAAYEGGGY